MVRAIWNDAVIAQSEDTIVVEGNHYFPPSAVQVQLLEPSSHTTVCGWKGTASYYDVRVGDEVNESAAWVYRDPKQAAEQINGRIAFWKGVRIES